MSSLSTIFTVSIFRSALETGCIYALVALALFISFSILNIADLTTDGCYTLGCAVGAMVTMSGHPFLALPAAMCAGALAGFVTAFLQTRLGVESILAGIIVNTGLYTINIMVMKFSSVVNIFNCDTIFRYAKRMIGGEWYKVIVVLIVVAVVALLLGWFLNTRLGLSIRATGDNASMVKASSINPAFTITVGLCVANSLTALAGCLLAQYQNSCDINIGTGMVTIALASLIIGETIVGKGGILRRVIGVILGSCLYRFIVAVAIRLHVPAECLKLVSAIIVAVAIATPYLKSKAVFWKTRLARMKENKKLQKQSEQGIGGK